MDVANLVSCKVMATKDEIRFNQTEKRGTFLGGTAIVSGSGALFVGIS